MGSPHQTYNMTQVRNLENPTATTVCETKHIRLRHITPVQIEWNFDIDAPNRYIERTINNF